VVATTLGKVIAVVGPTASGKTGLGLYLAERFGGEIICADSRTMYRGMDIGTAKPTREERARVPHHLLDLVEPGETLNAAAFKELAEGEIEEIQARGKLPILVGGSGLYIDAVLFDYKFPEGGEADEKLRARLESMGDDKLAELLSTEDPEAYETVDLRNRRRVIRAIETAGLVRSRRPQVREDFLVLGLTMNKEVAQKRIMARVKKMLEEGFLDEIKGIGKKYGWDSAALEVIGYRAMKDVVMGQKTLEDGVADFVRGDLALYKKQLTWFARNPEIEWVENGMEAEERMRLFLASAL
jgi:tRNA dimethylallyltransferase